MSKIIGVELRCPHRGWRDSCRKCNAMFVVVMVSKQAFRITRVLVVQVWNHMAEIREVASKI